MPDPSQNSNPVSSFVPDPAGSPFDQSAPASPSQGSPNPPPSILSDTSVNTPPSGQNKLDDGNQTPPSNSNTSDTVVTAPHAPKKYGGKKVIATIFGVLLLIGGVAAGVFLVQRQQLLEQQAASGRECQQNADCVLRDEPGNSGTFTAPRQIRRVVITNQSSFEYGPGDTNDGCYHVNISGNTVTWNKVGTGPDCKDISNVQVWLESEQARETPTPIPPVQISCPLTPQDGRIIVILNPSSDNQLRSDQQRRSTFGPVSTNIPAGTYKVTLVSYDNHSEHNPSQNQPREEWYLITNSAGNTGTISDLPESEDWLTQVVNESFNVGSTITSVTAHHAAFPDNSSANSVSPVCAAFDTGEVPSSTPTPTPPPEVSAQCNAVLAYDTDWNLLSSSDLNTLDAGDVVRFAVSGTASEGTFDKAKFTINAVEGPEVTTKKPGSDEFYYEYTIPVGVTSFNVSAQVHHTTLGWF